MFGPRLRPKLSGKYLLPPAELELIRLRIAGCYWSEYVAVLRRSREEQTRYDEWALRWDDPVT